MCGAEVNRLMIVLFLITRTNSVIDDLTKEKTGLRKLVKIQEEMVWTYECHLFTRLFNRNSTRLSIPKLAQFGIIWKQFNDRKSR